MADREKVIKGLELCVTDYLTQDNCKICPYGNGDDTGYCWVEMNTDALELLKEQDAEIEQLNRFVNGFSRDAVHVVRCKDCDNRECDGRAGTIVCGITGESHSRLWFCADGVKQE